MKVPAMLDVTQVTKQLRTPEIRVWCHPKKGGDDFWYVFQTFKDAQDFIIDNHVFNEKYAYIAEQTPLVAFKGYELNLYHIRPYKPKKKGNKKT